MKRLLILLTLLGALFGARGQPYTYEYLTNLVRLELPMNVSGLIMPTNFWNVFDKVLQSVTLPPTYIFNQVGSMNPAYGFRLGVLNNATGGEQQVVWDSATGDLRKTSSAPRTYGTATLSGGVYTIATPDPPYSSASAYPDGMAVDFRPGTTSGGSESLKVGSGPARPLKLTDLTVLPIGDIVANSIASVVFSSVADAFILQNPASGLVFDATLYTAINGPVVTVGVATNSLPMNRLATVGAQKLLGNPTGSAANAQEITLGSNLSFSGSTLNAAGGGGGSSGSVAIVTANYTIATNVSTVVVDASGIAGASITVTLPGAQLGQEITITRADTAARFVFVTCASTNAIVGVPNPFPLYFQGDTITFRGDGVSTNHYHLGGANWTAGDRGSRRFTAVVNDEFYASSSTAGPTTWSQVIAGTAASVGIADYVANGQYEGVFSFSSGNVTNGLSSLVQRGTLLNVDTFPIIAQIYFMIPAVSTDAEEFVIEVGLGDGVAQTDQSDNDCIVVRYRHRENSGRFQIRHTAAAAASAFVDTGVTMAAGTWYRATILVSSASAVVDINGTVVGPIIAGLPSGSGQALTYLMKMLKVGGSTGTNPRTFSVDRYDGSKYAHPR